MKPFPIEVPPGVVKVDSEYSLSGRYIDTQWVRFSRNKPEKIAGWEKFADTTFTGTCRTMLAFRDWSDSELYCLGTECKLLVLDVDKTFTNITPIDASGTLATDPFAVVDTETTVTVTHTAHGRGEGDSVTFGAASAGGGITIDGEYVVVTVPDADTYTITHTSAATSTDATTGGASVTYSYELSCGNVDAVYGGGYGVGTYGTGTYGTVRSSTSFVQNPRIWYLQPYGEDVLAMPSNGNLYLYDTSAGGAAAVVANAPTNNRGFFVTEERFIVVFGYGGEPMKIGWPEQDDRTSWTPSATNTANVRTLRSGTNLIAGTPLAARLSLLWSDTALYELRYTGSSAINETRRLGTDCGIIGPNAFAVAAGAAYWLAPDGKFRMFNGYVSTIPTDEDVRDWVSSNLNTLQQTKTTCGYNAANNEVWWIFPTTTDEPDTYVGVDLKDYSWIVGSITRTAWANKVSGDALPLMCGSDSYLYQHETGLDADGAALPWTFELAPIDIDDGSSTMDLSGLYPDFQRHVGDIVLTITAKDMPSDADDGLEVVEKIISPGDLQADVWMAGRQIGLKMEGSTIGGDFRLGKPRVLAQQSGSRR